MNEIDLKQRVAVLTGGSGGIGRAIAARLQDSGARVVVLDREPSRSGFTGADLFQVCDVTNEAEVGAVFADLQERMGRVDILVSNAGILGPVAPITDVPTDAWRRVIDVNLTGTFLCCRAAVPIMVKAGYGRIVIMSSLQGKDGMEGAGAYAASKAALIALTKTLGKELATTGVLVNCITPTAVQAGMFDEITEERRADIRSRIPMQRFCTSEEVAAMVAWVASEECSFSTGAVFDLSGGRATY